MVKACALALVVAASLLLLEQWGPLGPLLSPLLLPLHGVGTQATPLRHSREAEECHRVKQLPGRGKLGDLRLFSGTVPVSKDRALFYAMVGGPAGPALTCWTPTRLPSCSADLMRISCVPFGSQHGQTMILLHALRRWRPRSAPKRRQWCCG